MRRQRREVTIFSLSALDVLAMSTGVFVLLLLMMIPYFRKTMDAEAQLRMLSAAAAVAEADADALRRAEAREREDAEATAAQAGRAASAAAALEARAAAARAAAAQPVAPRPVAPASVPEPPSGTPTIAEMDLIFVVDTTASMTPAIRELAVSMRGIVRVLEQLVPSLRVGVVSYTDRDTGREPLAILPLTATDRSVAQVLGFLDRMQASAIGSRTIQEDVLLGLQAAVAMPLRPSARQALVLLGDAAAHDMEQGAALQLVQRFVAASRQRSVSALFITTPGAVANGLVDRRFFQEVARVGGGSFTDHTGSMVESILLSVLLE